mmetsp:Transcript_41285/g.113854  ORF Transcript_41285/g.113854 Transcript_41285/m.113854 type:complete len:301 (-) Transcript_41285:184-1086(-)
MSLWLGVLIVVLRDVQSSVGSNLQRYAQRPGRSQPALNILGVVLKAISGPLDAIAYSLAPQSMLAPVSMLWTLILDFVAAWRVHRETVSQRDIAAATLVASGTVVCLLHGARDDDGDSHATTSAVILAYVAIVMIMCAMLVGIMVAFDKVGGPVDALAHAALGGLLGSMSLVAGKGLVAASLTASIPSMACAGVSVALIVPTHLYVLNRGFGRHSLVFISPVGGAFGLLANVTTGFCLYSEVPVSPFRFGGGIALICGGVLALCMSKPRKRVAINEDLAAAHDHRSPVPPRKPSHVSRTA